MKQNKNNEVAVEVKNVTARFNMASEKIDNLKEYFIKLVKRELMFEEFLALKDVSFSVKKGESWGIIGINGSGKSTLLKVICGILKPYKGSVTVKGTIAPLIELGAGFDGDLTARENIYLNGAVLGHNEQFMKEHFDEIVEFAELENFLDMPIKNYSSGMAARLGFAIATVVKPDILICDEVLAVGDYAFQRKCEKRMKKMREEGTTLLYVSHSMESVRKICDNALWLEKGVVKGCGTVREVSRAYLNSLSGNKGEMKEKEKENSFTDETCSYGLLGANGAGKTTLMRMICDVQTETKGAIFFNGKNIHDLGEKYRNILGYLPQNFGYYPNFTAYKFLMYISAIKGLPPKKAHNRTMELLQVVDLLTQKNEKIKTFSGGMKQRLGIAQALLNDPRILILDEPTAGLDPKERVRFRNLISSLAENRIVILSTHIVSDVEYIANEILIMKNGELIQHGSPEEILKPIEKCVWECDVSRKEAEELELNYVTANLKHNNGAERLRIISQEAPCRTAWNVDPTLEDLYLYYFAEVSEHE